jgi:hypothetical protein
MYTVHNFFQHSKNKQHVFKKKETENDGEASTLRKRPSSGCNSETVALETRSKLACARGLISIGAGKKKSEEAKKELFFR